MDELKKNLLKKDLPDNFQCFQTVGKLRKYPQYLTFRRNYQKRQKNVFRKPESIKKTFFFVSDSRKA